MCFAQLTCVTVFKSQFMGALAMTIGAGEAFWPLFFGSMGTFRGQLFSWLQLLLVFFLSLNSETSGR